MGFAFINVKVGKSGFYQYMIIKDLASANLLLVLVIILVGFGVIKIVKKRFED
jgi:hypothetical protein